MRGEVNAGNLLDAGISRRKTCWRVEITARV